VEQDLARVLRKRENKDYWGLTEDANFDCSSLLNFLGD